MGWRDHTGKRQTRLHFSFISQRGPATHYIQNLFFITILFIFIFTFFLINSSPLLPRLPGLLLMLPGLPGWLPFPPTIISSPLVAGCEIRCWDDIIIILLLLWLWLPFTKAAVFAAAAFLASVVSTTPTEEDIITAGWWWRSWSRLEEVSILMLEEDPSEVLKKIDKNG